MKIKKIILPVLVAMGIVLVTIGATYAYFAYVANGAVLSQITVGNITFHYKEINGKGHGINITNAYPVASNANAKTGNDYFEFRITSDANVTNNIAYTVTAKLSDDSDILMGNIVDLHLTEVSGNNENATPLFSGIVKFNELENYNENAREKIIHTDVVTAANYNKTFRFRMWVDQDANLASSVVYKYYCGDTDVTTNVTSNANYKCTGDVSPSRRSIISSDYNDKSFSVTINVNATGQKKAPGAKEIVLEDENVQVRTLTLNKSTEVLENEGFPENGVYEITVNGQGYGGTANGGKTYIFRGDVTDNVVEFAGKLWRILRVNEDGTIRLILDSRIDDNKYKINENSSTWDKMYYSNSPMYDSVDNLNIKYTLENWYQANIGNNEVYDSKVAEGNYFCEAARVEKAENNSPGLAVMPLQENYIPDLTCPTDGNNKGLVSGKVGLITYDEFIYAGASNMIHGNRTFYLYKGVNGDNNYYFWTMSPSGFYNFFYDEASEWFCGEDGGVDSFPTYYDVYVRPVINLKADTVLTWNENTSRYVVQ